MVTAKRGRGHIAMCPRARAGPQDEKSLIVYDAFYYPFSR
jgi:hypothetical protein